VTHSYASARPSPLPRVDESIKLTDGRRLAYAEWGPPDGRPLIFFHGRPGSRLFCPDTLATNDANVRFISFDRPGYGRSDPAPPQQSIVDAVADVEGLVDQLELDQVLAVGWSGGGPRALAFAALAPQRVATVAVICSPGRPVVGDGSAEAEELGRLVAQDPVWHRDAVRERCQWLADDPLELLRLTERFDPDVLTAPGMRDAFEAWMLEAGRIGIEGYIDDWIAEVLPQVDLAAVATPTQIWFGELDPIVPPEHAEILAALLQRSTTNGCPSCRHFVPVAHWPEILNQLTAPHL
jgi:pimeloyl-ACP methyl ester carboxylesterase